MSEQLAALKICIERGKSSKDAPYPPDMKGQPGAIDQVCATLAEIGVTTLG